MITVAPVRIREEKGPSTTIARAGGHQSEKPREMFTLISKSIKQQQKKYPCRKDPKTIQHETGAK